jgi:NAD(P)H-dependent FMN reductase
MSLPRPRVSAWPLAALVLLLTACGAETASTAATAGAIKKNEIEQGRVVQEQVQQRLQQSLDQTQQRADQVEQATR